MRNKVFYKKTVAFLLMTLFLIFASLIPKMLQKSSAVIKLENFYAQDFETQESGTVIKSESDGSGTVFAVEEDDNSEDNESKTGESSDISGMVMYQETGDNDFSMLCFEVLLFLSYVVMIMAKYLNSSKKCMS